MPERPWRVGAHYGIHVYEPIEDSDIDRPVATFHTALDAAYAVRAVNLVNELSEPELVYGYVLDGVWHQTEDRYAARQIVGGLRNQGRDAYRAERKLYQGAVTKDKNA
jgi:hypothetical protein